jgi:kynurenine formamidase
MRLIDLSAPITASPPETPEPLRTEIAFHDHEEGGQAIEAMLGVPRELLRDGEGWATEELLRFGTHNSTHVDAPYHYNSRIRGEPAQTIDGLPLDWFFAPGVRLDFTQREDGEVISAEDLEQALVGASQELRERDIVLVHTGRDRHYEAPDYMVRGPGVSAEATRWLFERGVRVMGIDAWGWDAPLPVQAEQAKQSGEQGVFWAAHQADLPYSQIERLCNLGALPTNGFTVACFPLRIVGASAAPARVVAILD